MSKTTDKRRRKEAEARREQARRKYAAAIAQARSSWDRMAARFKGKVDNFGKFQSRWAGYQSNWDRYQSNFSPKQKRANAMRSYWRQIQAEAAKHAKRPR